MGLPTLFKIAGDSGSLRCTPEMVPAGDDMGLYVRKTPRARRDPVRGAASRGILRDLFASRRLDAHAPGDDMGLFTREIDNVRAALDWCFSSAGDTETGVILTAAYVPAWLHAALPTECSERTERAMDNLTPGMNAADRCGRSYTLRSGSCRRSR